MSNAVKKASSLFFIAAIHEFLGLHLPIVANPGMSFGLKMPLVLLILLNLIILFLFVGKKEWGLFLIFSGGMNNLIDRLRFGFVRDYWPFLGTGLYNNLNDWLIAVGFLIFVIELIWKKLK